MATFIKALWTLTFARRLSTLDINMMQLTSSRRPGQGSHEDAVGPCISYFPVRVKVQTHWTALDIFQFIHNQDVERRQLEGHHRQSASEVQLLSVKGARYIDRCCNMRSDTIFILRK